MKIIPTLTGNNLKKANDMLFNVASLLDENNIVYHLEGGTLLGIVRDNALLPWDHDIDISIPSAEVDKFLKLKKQLSKSYKLKFRYFEEDNIFFKKHDLRIIKVKYYFSSFLKGILPMFFRKHDIVLDIFVKYSDEDSTYWEAAGKNMKVSSKYYESFETVDFNGYSYKVPNHYKEYLTQKYGDWNQVVKEWDCSKDEKTIVR